MDFGAQPLSLGRLEKAVDAARDGGFAAISTNDHFVFRTPWLDGPTALASMIGRSGSVDLATTVSSRIVGGPRTASPTRWPRCGPGSRTIERRAIVSSPTSSPRF